MNVLTKPLFLLCLSVLFAMTGLFGGASDRLEVSIMQWLAELRLAWPSLHQVAMKITDLGGALVTLGLTGTATAWLLFKGAPRRALLLSMTVLIERLMLDLIKAWIGRPRPDFGVTSLPGSLAFPSGHSANSMTAFLATALILAPPSHRQTWAVGAILLSVAVGLSRIVLGVHWPTDVIGGWAFGLIAVAMSILVGSKSGVLSLEQQHKVVGRHPPALGKGESA